MKNNSYEKSNWSTLSEGMRPGGLQLTDLLIKRSGLCSGNVLDVGCGNGNSLRALSKLGFSCTGIDLSSNLIAEAKAHNNCDNENIKWICADVLETELCKKHFDAVLFECSISAISNGKFFVYSKLLNKAYAALKEGAYLLISDLYHKSSSNGTLASKGKWETLIKEAGFELTEFKDQSKYLRQFVAEWIWNGNTIESLFCDCIGDDSDMKDISYFALWARKECKNG